MEKFLEIFHLQITDSRRNLKSSFTVIKTYKNVFKIPKKKVPGPNGFNDKVYQ